MIKRRFYKLERGDRDSGSDSSSFSSDSELETGDSAESNGDIVAEIPEDDSVSEDEQEDESSSMSLGLVNADIYPDDLNTNVSVDDDDDDGEIDAGEHRERVRKTKLSLKPGLKAPETKSDSMDGKEPIQDIPVCMIKCKSVLKCRYCPNIICLNEATMRAHVTSKRHARSEKLLKDGKLKAILNIDGEVENQEIVEETHALDTTSVQEKQRKGSKSSRKQQKSSKRKEKILSKHGDNEVVVQQPSKKKRQTE